MLVTLSWCIRLSEAGLAQTGRRLPSEGDGLMYLEDGGERSGRLKGACRTILTFAPARLQPLGARSARYPRGALSRRSVQSNGEGVAVRGGCSPRYDDTGRQDPTNTGSLGAVAAVPRLDDSSSQAPMSALWAIRRKLAKKLANVYECMAVYVWPATHMRHSADLTAPRVTNAIYRTVTPQHCYSGVLPADLT